MYLNLTFYWPIVICVKQGSEYERQKYNNKPITCADKIRKNEQRHNLISLLLLLCCPVSILEVKGRHYCIPEGGFLNLK